jgi:hypothetical protein
MTPWRIKWPLRIELRGKRQRGGAPAFLEESRKPAPIGPNADRRGASGASFNAPSPVPGSKPNQERAGLDPKPPLRIGFVNGREA